MLYLKTILDRDENERIRKVYREMKDNPLKGDWIKHVEDDFKKIGIEINEKFIEETNSGLYKSFIKKHVWNAFFNQLQETKLTHIKVKHIKYENSRVPQKYLTNKKFYNKLCSLLFNLRCKSVNQFQDNQHTLYGREPLCKMCKNHIDSQEKALTCRSKIEELYTTEINMVQGAKYSDIFGNVDEQFRIAKVFQIILKTRENILASRHHQGLPGLHNSGPD